MLISNQKVLYIYNKIQQCGIETRGTCLQGLHGTVNHSDFKAIPQAIPQKFEK